MNDILKFRSIKEIKRSLEKISKFKLHHKCFDEYFDLCKVAFNGVVMPIYTFFPMDRTKGNEHYGILRARKFEGVIPKDPDFFWEPPSHVVKRLGRCNLVGESVFYGANHVSTALIESRANVGELWFVGYFDIRPSLGLTCFALGHSDHTIMEQAVGGYKDFYKGWDKSEEKKNKLIDNYVHQVFRKTIKDGSLDYYKTIAVTQYFLNGTNTKDKIHGLTYPSVASGVKGGNFMFIPKFARQALELKKVELFRVDSKSSFLITSKQMATASIEEGSMNWGYKSGFTSYMNLKPL